MTSLAAALAVALALGAGGSGAPSGDAPPAKAAPSAPRAQAATNAARARMGLLPRKATKKVRATTRSGRRIRVITALSHEPTLLGEPVPVADGPGDAGGTPLELVASSAPGPAGDAATGAPADGAEGEGALPPAVSAPVLVSDDVQVAAFAVVTEVTLSIKFR